MSERGTEAARQRRRNERIQRQLDEALADSFPASDPVSIVTSQDEEDWAEEAVQPGGAPAPPAKPQEVPAADGGGPPAKVAPFARGREG